MFDHSFGERNFVEEISIFYLKRKRNRLKKLFGGFGAVRIHVGRSNVLTSVLTSG